ncbi:MAG: hypothetical protein JWN66_4988 [Sphingomonas bacterium]|nr:hypothetical protein [Sphingomonas bacterium]
MGQNQGHERQSQNLFAQGNAPPKTTIRQRLADQLEALARRVRSGSGEG